MARLLPKTLLALLIAAVSGTALQPRQQIDDRCCFNLASVGTADNVTHKAVVESQRGDLILGDSFQQGSFCLDRASKTVQDSLKHNCFMEGPDYQFNCYQGAFSNTTFDAIIHDGKAYLGYDDGAGFFYACPSVNVNATNQLYNIYSNSKPDTDGCELVSLELTDVLDTCFFANSPPPDMRINVTRPAEIIEDAAPATPPTECIPKKSKQAIAPFRTLIRNEVTDRITYGSKGELAPASITPTNMTTFYFELPSRRTPTSKWCSLEFRMPECSALPEGYPCYKFSGVEHMLQQNAGFTVSRMGQLPGWNDTEVRHVFPGQTTTIGLFECGLAAGPHGWFAHSVRDFVLEFAQAGVGPNAKFQDGVGAWVVECE
ncbi:hypothetical protein F4821DRAFT_274709 [Hypoxylon rubiginosum]|uniref:Uncharacterized protein n=1 Tax=Hypoxylon rubiginosum TaxID=110542 RepID=A0ACC0DCS3_9PEZI|nr:hypothetical protein F4821DRAFT_274709 [Hypoxylon rubiginosum]